jgi:hypothetical protein
LSTNNTLIKTKFAMQTNYMKYIQRTFLFILLCTVLAGTMLTSSCNKDEGGNGLTVLNSYGPMPIARGAELRFIGENLDKVTAIILPDNIEIAASEFTSKSSTLITLTVPQNAVEGLVVLKSPDGDITTKTPMGFSEPISISNFSPLLIKSDSVLTINGDYLNLIKEVIFTDRVSVLQAAFISQSRTQIQVKVPAAAQTGKIAVSNGADEPIIVYSTSVLTVKLPALLTMAPNPVKAGTALTITGTNLDLVQSVVFGGNKNVTAFTSQSLTQIVLNVPVDAQDDTLKLIPASEVVVKSNIPLVMVVPTVTVTPSSVKNEADITVTGTNLDLVDQVVFGGNKQGTIQPGGTATQIIVTVPTDAVTGVVNFITKAAKTVVGPQLTIIDPVFTSFAPTSSAAKTDIMITGTDLDLVTKVVFAGGIEGVIGTRSLTEMTVTVPVGAKTGKITLVTLNGNMILSPTEFTVLANLPTITSFSEPKGVPGKIITLNGTNMSLIKQLIFPGDIIATEYGLKTDTKVEVYVPLNTTQGLGTIRLITYEGDEGITPEIYIGTVDPIKDPALMITDCSNPDIPGNWGGNIEVITSPEEPAYFGNVVHGTASALTGWAWLWGNNWYAFPSVTSADHVFKMDVNITKPFGTTNVHFQMELGGNRIDLGAMGVSTPTTTGWVTVSYDLSTMGLPETIPSGGEWGINFWYADGPVDITGLYIDNMRYEKK